MRNPTSSTPRRIAAEPAELREQLAAMTDYAERLAVAFESLQGVGSIAAAAWQDGFEKGQASSRPVPAPRDRHGLHVAGKKANGQ